MEYHICHNPLPKFNSILNYKIVNYGKRNRELLNNSRVNLYSKSKTIWKTKCVTFNFDKEELNQFPKDKLEALKKELYTIPGLGNEEDFIEYQYHYYDYIKNNKIEQKNLIHFEEEQSNDITDNTFNTTSLSDIQEYSLLNPSFYVSPSIVSSVHVSLLTSQIKIKYNPDFTNYLLLKNVILQSGLNIIEVLPSSCITVTFSHTLNKKISTTTIELPSNAPSTLPQEEGKKNDEFIHEFLNYSEDQEQNHSIPSARYQNKYNKSALLELICFSDEPKSDIVSGCCHTSCTTCLTWLKNFFCEYFFDQIDIQSIQFIPQPCIDLNHSIPENKSKPSYLSMVFQYHESAESFIFDDISYILNELNICVHKIHREYMPEVAARESVKRNSTEILKDRVSPYTIESKKVMLHSISFVIPKLCRASEATYLESKLLNIPGIKSPIKFDFMKRQCTIIYNSYQISVKDIINEMKNYHFDASALSDSFYCLSKEEEQEILNLPVNKANDIMVDVLLDKKALENGLIDFDQDEAERTEICYTSDSDEANLLSTARYANSLDSSTSSTEYMGNSSETMNLDLQNHANTDYLELKNKIEKRTKSVMDKRFILHSKIEKCFFTCGILTILSFITPYLFVWINYITNNSYAKVNLHLECILILLLSIPVQFYFGAEIHSTAFRILKSNKCECYYSNDVVDESAKNSYDKDKAYSECPLHPHTKKNHRLSRMVILSAMTWLLWIYSVIGLFVRQLQMYTNENKFESSHIYHEYFETSSLFITCYYLRKLLELSTKQYTINNISQFMHLQMKKAIILTPLDPTLSNCNNITEKTLKSEWVESIVDISKLKEGDIIKVLPGNRIPYNGSIVLGKTKLDESMISGHTKPVVKSVMDRVLSGTMNIESSIYVKILDVTDDCTFYSMIHFIEDVQLSKSSFHIFTDSIYKYLTLTAILLSILTLLLWTFGDISIQSSVVNEESLTKHYRVEFGIIFAISVLIVAFPFTMEFTFPIAISTASKIAMKYGILIKDDALTFKKLSELDIVVFNKDQVITNGNPSIVEIVINDNFSRFGKTEAFYEILKSLEHYSYNVYAKCIRNYIKKVEMSLPDKTLTPWPVLYYQETEGYNIIAKVQSPGSSETSGLDVYIGCEKWMIKQKCIPSLDQSRVAVWTERGYSILYVAINKVIVGMLGIHDNVRDGTKALIQCLKEEYHIEPWLLSYDNEASTTNTAKQIGIEENHCLYNVLPSEKQAKIQWLQYKYRYQSEKTHGPKSLLNSNFKITNASFDRELDDYRTYQEEGHPFDPFNPHGATNVFSNYNVIAPIPSMSYDTLLHGDHPSTPSTTPSLSTTPTAKNSNNVQISIEAGEQDQDYLIHQNNTLKKNMVAFIGNDINDSEVFSTADIGVCLGILNDISLDSSVITTIYQDVQCINKLLHLTKYINNYSYTTIIYLLLLHLLLLPVATGFLYPYTCLNPIWIFINLVLSFILHYYRAYNLKKVNF